MQLFAEVVGHLSQEAGIQGDTVALHIDQNGYQRHLDIGKKGPQAALMKLRFHQVSQLKDALLTLREELEGQLESMREGTRPVDLDEPIGRLTRIDAIQQQRVTSANRRSSDIRLRQVIQALGFMQRGDYGLCRKCEEPIGYARLSARPESPYCLECQDEIDRKHA